MPELSKEELSGLFDEKSWTVTKDAAEFTRRGIYLFERRTFLFPLLDAFDRLLESRPDARLLLLGGEIGASDPSDRHTAARVTRLLGLLRAHGLIKKVPRTHRYLLTTEGTSVIPALLAANNATLQQLTAAA